MNNNPWVLKPKLFLQTMEMSCLLLDAKRHNNENKKIYFWRQLCKNLLLSKIKCIKKAAKVMEIAKISSEFEVVFINLWNARGGLNLRSVEYNVVGAGGELC